MLANCLNFSSLMNKATNYWNANEKSKTKKSKNNKDVDSSNEDKKNNSKMIVEPIENEMILEKMHSKGKDINDFTHVGKNTMCSSGYMLTENTNENINMELFNNQDLSIIKEYSNSAKTKHIVGKTNNQSQSKDFLNLKSEYRKSDVLSANNTTCDFMSHNNETFLSCMTGGGNNNNYEVEANDSSIFYGQENNNLLDSNNLGFDNQLFNYDGNRGIFLEENNCLIPGLFDQRLSNNALAQNLSYIEEENSKNRLSENTEICMGSSYFLDGGDFIPLNGKREMPTIQQTQSFNLKNSLNNSNVNNQNDKSFNDNATLMKNKSKGTNPVNSITIPHAQSYQSLNHLSCSNSLLNITEHQDSSSSHNFGIQQKSETKVKNRAKAKITTFEDKFNKNIERSSVTNSNRSFTPIFSIKKSEKNKSNNNLMKIEDNEIVREEKDQHKIGVKSFNENVIFSLTPSLKDYESENKNFLVTSRMNTNDTDKTVPFQQKLQVNSPKLQLFADKIETSNNIPQLNAECSINSLNIINRKSNENWENNKNINININFNQSLNFSCCDREKNHKETEKKLFIKKNISKLSTYSKKSKSNNTIIKNAGNEIKKLKASSLEKLVKHYKFNYEAISRLFSDCTAKEIEDLYNERVEFKKINSSSSTNFNFKSKCSQENLLEIENATITSKSKNKSSVFAGKKGNDKIFSESNDDSKKINNINGDLFKDYEDKKKIEKMNSMFYKEIMSNLFSNNYYQNNRSQNDFVKLSSLKDSGISNSMIRALASKYIEEKSKEKENVLNNYSNSIITTNRSSDLISKYLSSSLTNTYTNSNSNTSFNLFGSTESNFYNNKLIEDNDILNQKDRSMNDIFSVASMHKNDSLTMDKFFVDDKISESFTTKIRIQESFEFNEKNLNSKTGNQKYLEKEIRNERNFENELIFNSLQQQNFVPQIDTSQPLFQMNNNSSIVDNRKNNSNSFNELFQEENYLTSNVGNFNNYNNYDDLALENIFNPNDYNKDDFNLEAEDQMALMKINNFINDKVKDKNINQSLLNLNQQTNKINKDIDCTINNENEVNELCKEMNNKNNNSEDEICKESSKNFNISSILNKSHKFSLSSNCNISTSQIKNYSFVEILRIQKLNSFLNCSFEKIDIMMELYNSKYQQTIELLFNANHNEIVQKTKETQDNITSLSKSLKIKFSKYEHIIYLTLHKIIDLNSNSKVESEVKTIDSVSFIVPQVKKNISTHKQEIQDFFNKESANRYNFTSDDIKEEINSIKNSTSEENSFNVISISLSKKIEILSHMIQLSKLKITWYDKIKDIEV